MKKIIFGITSLGLGGAERVLVDLANRLSKDYDITIFMIYDGGELKKELDPKIRKVALYRKKYEELTKIDRVKASLKLIIYKKKIYNAIMKKGYSVQISFLEGPVTRLFSVKNKEDENNKTKKIAWIHNDISKVYGNGLKSAIKKLVDGKVYKKYDKLIFVSNENLKDFNKTYKWAKNSDEDIIRNYIDYNKILKKAEEIVDLPYDNKSINLLTVCRLVEQKALDRFIKVKKELEDEGIHFKVYIVGDGPLRYSLQKQIDSLELTENFILLGKKENPYPYIKFCDYFCLLSYYEGYGMVLEEAKILNKPIIITNTAATECINGYENAIVLDNTFEGIKNGIREELKKDNAMYLKNEEGTSINDENEEKIIRKIKDIL